jgi:hypothetical protein
LLGAKIKKEREGREEHEIPKQAFLYGVHPLLASKIYT